MFFALTIMFFSGQVVLGQNTIKHVEYSISTNSLIRNLDDSIDIVYNTFGRQSFMLVNRNSNYVLDAFLPNLGLVTDMEIVGKELYFCGSYNGKPAIGRFELGSFFGGGGSAEIVQIDYFPIVEGITGSTALKKLEVQYLDQDDIHVYAIGLVTFGNPNWNIPDYTALFECIFNGTAWDIEEIHSIGWVYRFYDLTVTNNYLYVVGEKFGGQGDYANVYSFPPIPPANQHLSNSLPAPYAIQMLNVGIGGYYPISESLAETLTGDEFVTACYGYVNGNTGIVISRYNNPYNIYARYLIPNVTASTRFIDLKYNDADKMLYLIPDKANSVTTDMMYVFDLQYESARVFRTSFPYLCSVDRKATTTGSVVSGITTDGEVGIWGTAKPDNNCTFETPLTVNRYTHSVNPWQSYVSISYPINTVLSAPPRISEYNLKHVCPR